MPATAILGLHWGDEGKGKVIDLLADRFDYNVRYSGGANAGHTVVNHLGSFALHQVPSGIFDCSIRVALSSGALVHPPALLEELEGLERRGLELDNLYISERAHLVLPYHLALDRAMEEARGEGRIGTTGMGIGPAYTDKVARDGLRAGDMLDLESFVRVVRRQAEAANRKLTQLYGADGPDVDAIVGDARRWARALAPRVCDVEHALRSALRDGASLLMEGAQGALLDIDAGSYPYVTSSSTGAAGACTSAGIPPSSITSVVGVMRTFMTRVGAGPFPTELYDETGDQLRSRGNEFGTTTGRPRRCGWFDAVATRYAVDLNGVTSLVVTKLDVLDGFETVRVCTGYRVGGRELSRFPANAAVLAAAEPVYQELPGWSTATQDARRWSELPPEAQAYVLALEELMGVPVAVISVGPARDQTITLRDPLG